MADSYIQGTVWPLLPLDDVAVTLTALQGGEVLKPADFATLEIYKQVVDYLAETNALVVDDGGVFIDSDWTLSGVNLDAQPEGGLHYIYFDHSIDEPVFDFLQWVLRRAPESFTHVTVEWAVICSRMRPGEFGGSACLITREGQEFMDTGSWLRQRISKLGLE